MDTFTEPMQSMLGKLNQFLHSDSMSRVLGAILVILLALLFKRIFARISVFFLRKLTSKTSNVIDDHLVKL